MAVNISGKGLISKCITNFYNSMKILKFFSNPVSDGWREVCVYVCVCVCVCEGLMCVFCFCSLPGHPKPGAKPTFSKVFKDVWY